MLYNQIFWTALSLSLLLMAQMANGGNGYNESEDDKDSLYLPLLAHGANGDNESEDDKAETPCEEAPHIAYSDSEDGKMEISSEEEPHIADSDSEDGIIELSLSQASLFLTKMDEFFFKCDVFNVNTKRDCLKDLKIADLRNLFCQNAIQNEQQSVPDQQKPSSSKDSRIDQKKMTERVVDSDLLMKLLIVKGMQKLNNPSSSLQQLRKKFTKFLKVFDLFSNIYGMKAIKELTAQQNLLIFYGLLRFSIEISKQIYEKIYYKNEKKKLKLYVEPDQMINFKYYKNLEDKFDSISLEISTILFDNFGIRVDHFSNVFSDLNIQIKWIEGEETKPEKIKFRISMKNIAQMLEKIALFIFSNCNNQHLWYFENESEEIKNCANRINFDELAENISENEQKNLFNLFVTILSSEEQVNKAKTLEMLRQHGPFDEPIWTKIFDYHNNNKFSILTGLLQFGRIFTEKFSIYAVKKIYLGLNVEMLWKNITIHIYMYDHPGEEMDALERFLKSAGLI